MADIKPTSVVHFQVEKCDTYIGRPSAWGNPFSHKRTGTLAQFIVPSRDEAVKKYRTYILKRLVQEPDLQQKFEKDIRNKVLGCWCKPANCHGDVLAEIAGQLDAGVDFESQLKASGEDEAESTIKRSGPTPID